MKACITTKGIAMPVVIALVAGLMVLAGVIYYNSGPQGEIMKEMGEDVAEEGKAMIEKGEDMKKEGESMMEEGDKMMDGSDATIE